MRDSALSDLDVVLVGAANAPLAVAGIRVAKRRLLALKVAQAVGPDQARHHNDLALARGFLLTLEFFFPAVHDHFVDTSVGQSFGADVIGVSESHEMGGHYEAAGACRGEHH